MGIFDGILLASDFDGTLYYKKTIAPEDSEALRYFQSEGGMFTLASGREATFIRKFGSYFRPNVPVISLNGSVIYDLEEDRLLACRAFQYGQVHDVIHAVYRAVDYIEVGYIFDLFHCHLLYGHRDLNEQLRHHDPVVTKLVFRVSADLSDEALRAIRTAVGNDFEVCRSCRKYIEIMTAQSGKGNGVRTLCDVLNGRVRKTVCVGDYENDLSMIRAADVGYAVGNAVPLLKAAADRVTVHCRRHAIATIIRDLEADVARGR
jgi:Cof subfamily protein (haloacid dehalogenase superfamily)